MLRFCYAMLTGKEKREYWIVLVVGVLSAISELSGVVAVIPVVEAMASTGNEHTSMFDPIIGRFLPDIELSIKVYAAIGIVVVIMSALIRMLNSYVFHRYVWRVEAGISVNLLKNFSSETLEEFLARTESEMVRDVARIGHLVGVDIIGASIQIFTRLTLMGLIMAVIIIINPKVGVTLILVFSTCYLIIHALVRKKISDEARRKFILFGVLHRIKTDLYKSFREMIVFDMQRIFIREFTALKRQAVKMEANMNIVAEIPKNVLEMLGIIALILVTLYLSGQSSGQPLLANMALLVVAAYRVLPAAQQVFHGAHRMTTVAGIFEQVRKSAPSEQTSRAWSTVKLRAGTGDILNIQELVYRHPGEEALVLENFNFDLELEGIWLLKGISGAGKSTLLDILAGLRAPTSGRIVVNEVEIFECLPQWWGQISFCSQGSSTFGKSIVEIVAAHPTEQVDKNLLDLALKTTQLDQIISSREIDIENDEIHTLNFSGGETSRLLLARALYKRSVLCLLDEPFAALDLISAQGIVELIRKNYPDRCFLIVSHRAQELGHPIRTLELG